jgi:signal transduction histidine kinase
MSKQAETRISNWKVYSPWVILLLGLAATVVTWRVIVAHEVEEIGWATHLAAEAIGTDLREDMEWQRIGLDRLGLLWEGADAEGSLWTSNAELYIEHRPGCVAVEWIGTKGERRTVFMKTRTTPLLAFNGMPQAALDIARETRNSVFSTTDALGDGTMQWAVVHPVYTKNELRGWVVSFFDVAHSIDENLADVRGLGFSFAVVFPTQKLEHSLPETNREHEKWATTVTVPLAGVRWLLRVWPNPGTMIRIRSLLPLITLVVGSALSLLAFLTFYFAARIARSSADVALTNEALQREIAVREGAERELRRARDELDERVSARTTELATANVLLRQEIINHEHAEESLRELTGRIFHLRDEEQRRLARELHDGATQTLIALATNLAMIRDVVPADDPNTKTLISDSVRLLQQCTEELRTISYLLHPPLLNELGLVSTLHDFVEGFQVRSGVRVSLHLDPALERFEQQLELTVFRVVQEALSNVRRHAQSQTASISLEQHSGYLHLEIADAGRGIPPEILSQPGSHLSGVGIAGMRERVRLLRGRFEIQSDKAGTRIHVVLPVHPAILKEAGTGSGKRVVSGKIAAA